MYRLWLQRLVLTLWREHHADASGTASRHNGGATEPEWLHVHNSVQLLTTAYGHLHVCLIVKLIGIVLAS
jgi:hypothetical protein